MMMPMGSGGMGEYDFENWQNQICN
jgi:hypothetical protein